MFFLVELRALSLQLYYHTKFFADFFQEFWSEVLEQLLLQNKYQCLLLVFPNKHVIWHYIDLPGCSKSLSACKTFRSLITCVCIKMQNDLKPSLKTVTANHFLGFNLNGSFDLKRFHHWERSMFLHFRASSVPIWSGTSIFYILGRLMFLFGQEQIFFYIFHNWEHL